MRLWHVVLRGLALVGILGAGACVPLSMAPSPVPLAGAHQHEFGVQNDVVFPLQEAGAQFWYRRDRGDDSEVFFQGGTLLGYGIFPYLGAGYRRYWVTPDSDDVAGFRDSMSLGWEFSGGAFAWFQMGLPMSARLGRSPIWLTSNPTVGLNNFGFLHLPVGTSLRVSDGVRINAVLGGWFFRELSFREYRLYSSAGVSFPW